MAVNIKTVMMEYNKSDARGIVELAKDLSATIQPGLIINAKNNGDTSNTDLRIKSIEDYVNILSILEGNILFEKNDVDNEARKGRDTSKKICNAGMTGLGINPNGDVFPCNAFQLKLGNVKEHSIKDIWENSPVLTEWRKQTFDMVGECVSCEKKNFCFYCPGTAYQEKGTPFAKYDEACVTAEAKQLLFDRK
jgi:radical SAM protein with 4Fe4S-binding SPASM domain